MTSIRANLKQDEETVGGRDKNNDKNKRNGDDSLVENKVADGPNDVDGNDCKMGIFSYVENIEEINGANEKHIPEEHSHGCAHNSIEDKKELDNM